MFDLDILQTLAGGGWSELENMQERFGKQAREQGHAENEEIKRQAAIFARTFGTDDGRQALDLLVKMTLLRQPDDEERAARSNAEAYAIAKARREGEGNVIFLLLARLQQHGKIKRAAEEQAAADAQAERDRAAAESQNRKNSKSSRSRRRQSGGEP